MAKKTIKRELVDVELSQLKEYANNPRNNDQAVAAVAESIRQCEYVSPIIVDEDFEILAGHTRRKALLKLGKTSDCVMKISGLTEAQKKKFRLLDNKTNEFASWDLDKLTEELADLDFEGFDFQFDEAEFDEKDEKTAYLKAQTQIIVECDSEEDAEDKFNRISALGIECHISTL